MTDTGRASPPTARVVAVLDFLAGHPQEQFGLSELARRLDLSKPTCLGIVTTRMAFQSARFEANSSKRSAQSCQS